MRSGVGRVACGVIGTVLVGCWPGVEVAFAAAIRGVVVNAGPPPERKQIPINIDQYVCGKSRESEDLVVGANRGVRWAVVSLHSPPAGPRPEPSSKPVQMDQQQCVYIPRVVVLSFCRELAPTLTAVIVGGRIGSGMAAEVGAMNVTEQVDAIRALGADPAKKLVLPRMVAAIIVMPILSVYALALGIAGAVFICSAQFDITPTFLPLIL